MKIVASEFASSDHEIIVTLTEDGDIVIERMDTKLTIPFSEARIFWKLIERLKDE